MKLATGPYTLPGGGHISISLPAATLLVRAVIIGNLTPAAVTVTIAGQTSHLLPATANLFTLSSGSQGIVVTSLGTATQSGTITAEWLTPATVPGSGYPMGGAVTNLTLGPDATVKITGPVTIAGPVSLAAGSKVGVTGGQLADASGVANQPTSSQITGAQFGSGVDGAVTLTASATLTRDMHYTTLTVDAGVTLTTAGYRVLAKVAVINNGTFTNSASGATPGAAGTLEGGSAGVKAHVTSTATDNVVGTASPTATITGGAGGGAKALDTNALTAGGAAGAVPPGVPTASVLSDKSISGGASGAASAYSDNPNTTTTAIAHSGAGGGVVYVAAPSISGSGVFAAVGGSATAAAHLASRSAAGGGGGGGMVVLAGFTLDVGQTQVHVGGGAGAITTSSGGGPVAYSGTPGRTVLLATSS